jgi:hypothetical protein
VEVLSTELTESAIQYFKFHPNFTPVPKQCLLCGEQSDVCILFDDGPETTYSVFESVAGWITDIETC